MAVAFSYGRKERMTVHPPFGAHGWQEVILGVALALWTYCQLVVSNSTVVGSYSVLQSLDLPRIYPAIISSMLVAVIAGCASRMDAKGLALTVALGSAIGISRAKTGDTHLLILFLTLVAAQGKDLRRLARYWLFGSLGALATVLLMATRTQTLVRFDTPNGFLVCSYGFFHPNTFGCLLFGVSVAMWLAFDGRRWRAALAVIYGLCALFSYRILSCRTGAALQLALAFVSLAYGLWQAQARRLLMHTATRVSLALLPILLCLCMNLLLVAYVQGNDLARFVNQHLGARLTFAGNVFEDVGGFTRLGRSVSFVSGHMAQQSTESFYSVDSGYLYATIIHGLFVTVCLAAVYLRAVWHMRDGVCWTLLAPIIVLYSLYFLTEGAPTWLEFNCSLVFLSAAFGKGGTNEGDADARTSRAKGWQACALIALGACLCGVCVQSLQNGTGEISANAELPKRIVVQMDNEEAHGIPVLSFRSDNDDTAHLVYEGKRIDGRIRKTQTQNGSVMYALKQYADDGTIAVAVCSVPDSYDPASPSGTWAVCVKDSEGNQSSAWVTLNDDRTCSLGRGDTDFFAAGGDSLSSMAQEGTWGLEKTADGDTRVVIRSSNRTVFVSMGQNI